MKVASTVADGWGDKLKSLLQRRRTQDSECAADQLRFEDLEPQTLVGRLYFDYDATEEPRAQAIVEVF